MEVSKERARRAAIFFLTLLGGAFIAWLAFFAYQKIGPKTLDVAAVPFGMPEGTKVTVGDLVDTLDGFSRIPRSTQQEILRATELRENGKLEESAEIDEAISLQYPEVFLAKWGAFLSLVSQDSLSAHKESRLESIARSLKVRYPESSVAFYVDARLALRSNSRSTAIELARISAGKAPAFAAARLLYGKLLSEEKRIREGEQEVRAAIGISGGTDPDAYRLLAEIYHDEGMLDSCELVVEYALSKFPLNPELLCLQGILQEYRGKFEDAENTYRRILAIRPDFKKAKQALNSLGQKSPPGVSGSGRISPQERAKVAYDILEPLVSAYPENLPLREALGRAYLKGRDFDRAKVQFREIASKDPDYPEIQLRLQEASAVPSAPEVQKNFLADNLTRAIDSMRTLPSSEHSFETSLGHYLVRYGASAREFFSKYSAANFKKVGKENWQEVFFEAPYFHRYTVLFDKGKFYGVHVVVTDSNIVQNRPGVHSPEIYSTMLQQNSRLSGVGTETGETDCSGVILSGATWETRDNFEMLARISGKPEEIRMIRLDKSVIPDGMRLCDNLKYLMMY